MKYSEFEEKFFKKYGNKNFIKAYLFAEEKHRGKYRLTGDEFITHPLEVANILIDMNASEDVIIAALLHEVMNNGETEFEELKENFGEDTAKVVDSVTKINKLELTDDSESSSQYLRKILVGMAEDVRVLYIKLADRLHNMRTNYAVKPEKQKEKAKETLNILVPIAHRLGMNKIKGELENLCLYYLKPDVYNDILEKLNASKEELSEDLEAMKENLSNILKDNEIIFEIKGRVKSVYSIYNKLNSGKKWSDIYDILALRIFVNTESECYATVGLIHAKYKHLEKRFKDYVANPKENMYQSLHTSIVGDSGRIFEIQIRTYEMDLIAEKGIASHWSYKEKGSKKIQNIMEQKLEMFRNVIESNNSLTDSDFEESVESEILKNTIYVYTPKGDVVELPLGATPIDFAYRIHSNVGDKTVGAIVNDLMVPFDYELNDGDIVKIKTNATAKPNKDWLNIVKTAQAKNKIKSFFSKESRSEYITRGKNIIEKELRKKKMSIEEFFSNDKLNKILSDLKLNDVEELYLSIGSLRYTAGYIINLSSTDKNNVDDILINKTARKSHKINSYKNDVIVDGHTDILVSIAKCCSPVKGDDIVGIVTKNSGVSIHKKTCVNVSLLSDNIVDVEWNFNSDNDFSKIVYIKINNDNNFLSSLIEVVTKKNSKIESFKELSNMVYEVTLKVKNIESLDNVINAINRLMVVDNVSEVYTDL